MTKILSEGKFSTFWNRLFAWVKRHHAWVRRVGLPAGVIAFLTFLPSAVQIAFRDGLRSQKLLSILLIVFSLLTISLVWSTGQKLDAWVFIKINTRGSRPIWLDQLMATFTQFGSGIPALGIALIFYWTAHRQLAYELALGTISLWLVVELIKLWIYRSRPFIHLSQARIVGRQAIGRSFPSGHTSQAFFLVTLLNQHFHPYIWALILLYVAALLVGLTRIYVGAHYPRDVMAGAILGSTWGLLVIIMDGNILASG